ncbi:MAG: murein biosynthesis integral membrane protein MurJ, partial [Chthoniobacterales bacterium]|nr:murein biosynthesis integral membrane protein MurJ [Chthoniobacterales bacterium]
SQREERVNASAAVVVGIAVMCSRILGLAREVIFAALFGAGRGMDAFFIAFKAPNLLRDLFAEGALSTAFVTVFSKKIQNEGESSAWSLASKIATLATVFLSGIVLLGIFFANQIVGVLAPGFDAEKARMTILLTRIMFPFILMVSLAALAMGILNARNVFGVPAMASSFFNLGSIVGGVVIGWIIDPQFGPQALVGLALGTLIGGFLQLAVQVPSLRKVGFRFRWDFRWRDEGVRSVLALLFPSVIAGSAVQVNVMINSMFASFLQDGAVSWLQYAFRLMQLPLGIFGVAIATVTLPAVSRLSASGEVTGFRRTLSSAMRLAVFLTLPSSVGLAVLATPIIRLIYERGKFGPWEAERTAEALQMYAIGLVGYACVKVLAPAFYALNRRWVPMLVSLAAIGVNVALNYSLIILAGWGHRGLALSTAISATTNFSLLYLLMRFQLRGLESWAFFKCLFRCAASAVLMGLVVLACKRLVLNSWEGNFFEIAIILLILIGVGVVVYSLGCWFLRVEELKDILHLVVKKLQRKFGRKN